MSRPRTSMPRFMLWLRSIAPALLLIATAVPQVAFATARATAIGQVRDAAGNPVPRATVIVYEARVRHGYSVFCPTCWLDCGKRAVTDVAGNYAIKDLDPALKFTLLVLTDGYAATFVSNVDPIAGPAPTVRLAVRLPIDDVTRVVRGHVQDDSGHPLADAIIEPRTVMTDGPDGRRMMVGSHGWTDSMAVSDGDGDFEIAYGQPAVEMRLRVGARGKALTIVEERTGGARKVITLGEGATVGGRLLDPRGKAVPAAEVVLVLHRQLNGEDFGELSVGTRDDGSFAIPNVPAGRIWTLFARMDSLASRNLALAPLLCETGVDQSHVDVGTVRLRRGHSLQGQLLSSGDTRPPSGTNVILAAEDGDTQRVVATPNGRFDFTGLASGVYSIMPAVPARGELAASTREILVDRDRSEVVIHIQGRDAK